MRCGRLRPVFPLILVGFVAGCVGAFEPDRVHRVLGGQRITGRYVSPYAYEHFMHAQLAFDAGDYARAAENIDLALTSDPESTYLLAWHARALDLAGRPEDAERRIAEALEIDRDAELAWTVRGEIAERRGRPDEAERCFRRAVRAAPRSDEAVLDLGAFFERRGRAAAAQETYRVAVARRPGAAKIWQALGRIALDEGQTDVALDALLHAARAGRLDRRGLVALAEAERRMGRPGRAVEILGMVTTLQPRDVGARAARADAAIDAGLGKTARELVDTLRLHEPERPTAVRSARLLAAGHPREAADEARAAIALDASDPQARLALARALATIGDDGGMTEALAGVSTRGGESVDATLVLVARMIDARELDSARLALDALVVRAPDDARVRRLLADVALRQGDLQSAERVLAAGGVATSRDLAALLGDADRMDEAVRALRAATTRGSTDARVWADLALWERAAGDSNARRSLDRARALGAELPEVLRAEAALAPVDEAEERFAVADRARPGDARLLALWAEHAEARGRHDESRALFERALRLQPSPMLRAKLERRLRSLAGR